MHWLTWLGLAVLIAGIAAVTGLKPSGGRPVARTQMMTVARIVLVVIGVIFLAMAIQAFLAA